jgi:hypothetical protein
MSSEILGFSTVFWGQLWRWRAPLEGIRVISIGGVFVCTSRALVTPTRKDQKVEAFADQNGWRGGCASRSEFDTRFRICVARKLSCVAIRPGMDFLPPGPKPRMTKGNNQANENLARDLPQTSNAGGCGAFSIFSKPATGFCSREPLHCCKTGALPRYGWMPARNWVNRGSERSGSAMGSTRR